MIKNALTIILSLLLLQSVNAAKTVSGSITKSTSWTSADNPITITGNVDIPDSIVLKIEPGTVIRFDGYFRLLVRGSLEANGEAGKEIEFTSNKETPAVGDWEGIIFYGEKSGGFLKNCKIKHAFKNFIWKSAPFIQSCQFAMNNYALYCSYSKASKIIDNKITKNNFGIYCDYSSPLIQRNSITDNSYGIYCVLSSAPIVGDNNIAANSEKDIYMDDSLGKNEAENVNNHVWDLMKGLF
ncbi:MAG: right-handed parallel beta-helix repeat-containing protein [Fibrobacteres bacterium]|nr:right-handed parallel beta-helix repeat-containing protein [Fibrobacterota bacterium]